MAEETYVVLKLSDDSKYVILEVGQASQGIAIQVDLTQEEVFAVMLGLKEGLEQIAIAELQESEDSAREELKSRLTVIKGGKDDTIH